jgi:hypothetical protein
MGKILRIDNFWELVPTQSHLNEKNFNKLLPLLKTTDKKLIIPLKNSIKLNKSLIIDGHHTASIVDYLNLIGCPKELYGYFPENKDDIITNLPNEFYKDKHSLFEINYNIGRRFNNLEEEIWENIPSIRELREQRINTVFNLSLFFQ